MYQPATRDVISPLREKPSFHSRTLSIPSYTSTYDSSAFTPKMSKSSYMGFRSQIDEEREKFNEGQNALKKLDTIKSIMEGRLAILE